MKQTIKRILETTSIVELCFGLLSVFKIITTKDGIYGFYGGGEVGIVVFTVVMFLLFALSLVGEILLSDKTK